MQWTSITVKSQIIEQYTMPPKVPPLIKSSITVVTIIIITGIALKSFRRLNSSLAVLFVPLLGRENFRLSSAQLNYSRFYEYSSVVVIPIGGGLYCR